MSVTANATPPMEMARRAFSLNRFFRASVNIRKPRPGSPPLGASLSATGRGRGLRRTAPEAERGRGEVDRAGGEALPGRIPHRVLRRGGVKRRPGRYNEGP